MVISNHTQVPINMLHRLLTEAAKLVEVDGTNVRIFCRPRAVPEQRSHARRAGKGFFVQLYVKDKYESMCPGVRRAWGRGEEHSLWRTMLHEFAHVRDFQRGDLGEPQGWSLSKDKVPWADRPEEQRAVALVDALLPKTPHTIRTILQWYRFHLITAAHEFVVHWTDEKSGWKSCTCDISSERADQFITEWRETKPRRRYSKRKLPAFSFLLIE